jgi:O-antigen/teichoic acid export membrane protein
VIPVRTDLFNYMAFPVIRALLSVLVTVPVTTFYLSPEDFGVVALVNMITWLIPSLSVYGFWVLQGHYFKTEKDQRGALLFSTICFVVSITLFWCVLFWVLSRWALPLVIKEFDPDLLLYFDLSLLGMILVSPSAVLMQVLVLENKSFMHSVIELGQYLTGLLITVICLAVFDLKVLSMFLAPVGLGGFVMVCSLVVLGPRVRVGFDKTWLREAARRELPSIPLNFSNAGAFSLATYFIQRWGTLGGVGLYNHSLSYRQMMMMSNEAFIKAISPGAIKALSHDQSLEPSHSAGRAWMCLLGLGGVFITTFAREMLEILTHGKFVEAAPMMGLWFILVLASAWNWFYSQYLTSRFHTKVLTITGIAGGVTSMILSAGLVYHLGAIGAVLGVSSIPLTCGVLRRYYAKRNGAPSFLDRRAMVAALAFSAAYVISQVLEASFYIRAVTSILLAAWLVWDGRLWRHLPGR